MRRPLLVLLLALALCPAGVLADEREADEEPAKPLTAEQAADAVLDALNVEDTAALKALVEQDDPDPWLVVDVLCSRGSHDAAEQFAKAAPRKAVERLAAYVSTRRAQVIDTAGHRAFEAQSAALDRQDWQAALDATEGLTERVSPVMGILLVNGRGKAGAASTLCDIGRTHSRLGDQAKARRSLERSARAARSLRATPVLVSALESLAHLHLAAGNPARALAVAQRALRETEGLLGGLGEEQGARAREQFAHLFAVGALAAVREEDVAEALTFLESGRAGALLDALGKREALRWKAESLPEDLRQADLEARAAENVARHAYDRAVERGGLQETRAAARALDEALEDVRAVAGRIQRELKQQAGLFYPRAKTLYDLEEALAPDQALVLYGLCLDEVIALVLRRDGERVVSLGSLEEVRAACDALDCTDARADPAEALAALRALLIEPLELGADVKQVLVSPEGPLCYLPFGALFDRPVAMTPSGTTHVLLLDEEREPGEGILALGAPDYSGVSEGAKAIYHRARRLELLLATRPEVESVGTVRLLGAEASEAGLREALPKSKRWKAVHFACHGLIDVERPMLSSLALTSAGEDDGFLTALEVLRMEIPADLAVLSACETATGEIVRGEGIVGLTRAFMFAGAPRVICSLWKVDDEATRALMIKFYELWNPKDGEGLGAAEALKKAQAFIRDHPDHPDWKHPYYWAAWVLWGLPN